MFTHFFNRHNFQRCISKYHLFLVCSFIYFSACHEIVCGNDIQTPAKAISLKEAIDIALERNPELQSMKDQVEAQIGSLKQAGLYPNPVINFLAEEMPTDEIGLNESQNQVSITQPIITGGKRGLAIKVSEKAKEKNEFERDSFLLSVIADTKKAFYKVLAGQESHSVAKETEKISKDIYESEKTRFEAGEVALTNVFRAEVEFSKAKNLVSRTEGELQNSFRELQTIMGIPEATDFDITGKLITTPMELSFHELERSMKNNQPLLRVSEKNIEIAEAGLLLEQRQAIPDITVSAGYKRLSQEDADTIQFSLGIPAPFFNRNQGNIQKGKALSRKAKNESMSVYQQMLFELKKNFNLYNIERRRLIEFKNKILPGTEKALSLITNGYKEGEFDYIDLLDTQRIWADTRVSYIDVIKQLNLIIADIERLAVIKIGK